MKIVLLNLSVKHILFLIITILTGCSSGISKSTAHINLESTSLRVPISSWKQLRDSKIEKQDEDFSCGSAATATILRYFYGEDVYERDILDRIVANGNDGSASFKDIGIVVKDFGYKAVGVTLDFNRLKQMKIPAIVFLKHGKTEHFSVIRGVNSKGLVHLGDPSWGNRKFTAEQFLELWSTDSYLNASGKALVIIPLDKQEASISQDFFTPPENQNNVVERLKLRL